MRVINITKFLPCDFPQRLAADAIHLWFFPRWPERLRQVAQSPLLLALLAAYAGRNAADLCIERGEHGKPYLHNSPLEFNLSHSGTALLLGLSRQQPLGVDIEALQRDRPVLDLAHRWFSAREAAALDALPESLHQLGFRRLWNCKEAVLKAYGRGIGYGLEQVAFDLDSEANVAAIGKIGGGAESAAWQIRSLTLQEGVTGALAWCGPAHAVSAFVADADHINCLAPGL